MTPVADDAEQILLRAATEADLGAIIEIEQASFRAPRWSWRSFAGVLIDPYARFTVACDARTGVVTGYIVTHVIVGDAEIANLAVAPNRRSHGIGGRLLDVAIDDVVALGAGTLHLEVRESNLVAQALYGSRGFAVVGRRKQYYQSPTEDALLLRREITDDQARALKVMGSR